MKPLIKAVGLTKYYGDRIVVNKVNLNINEGEVVAIVGPNGAGKSTTIEMLLGMRKPDEGHVTYWCKDYKKKIGVQLQTTPLFDKFTVIENVNVFNALYGNRLTKKEIEQLLDKFDLLKVKKNIASQLSGGQKKRLSIALAIAHRPKMVFLDEPTGDLDPIARQMIRNMINQQKKEGTSFLFTSHFMEEVEKIADRILILVNGSIREEGTPEELLKKHDEDNLENLYFKLCNQLKEENYLEVYL